MSTAFVLQIDICSADFLLPIAYMLQVVISAADGLAVLNNGKHWVAALREVKPLYEKAKAEAEAACPPAEAGAAAEVDEESSWPEWLVPELRRVFAEGLLVDYLKYPSDDRLTHIAMQCLAHEQDQNRYRASTVGDKVAGVLGWGHGFVGSWVCGLMG